ncbi:hypothetical protein LAZ67_X003274 [Cordylochernes scorpioides]|uniref:Uncharacterized protein n=1 Tax=Cordylochernes scorpioides TaxID=51811 RepID=A0ABY6LY72_9ARAC|nr:hypothetical protein LAZ67_X003274 [Cordylochernes scorpioides]
MHQCILHQSTTDNRFAKIAPNQNLEPTLQNMAFYSKIGWPAKCQLSPLERLFYGVRDEIGEEHGLLMRGLRVIIPSNMGKVILNYIHAGHQGITKCRTRAKYHVKWPGIGQEIQDMVKPCEKCIENQPKRHEPLIPNDFQERPWQKKTAFDRRHAAMKKAELIASEKVWVKDLRAWGSVVEKASAPRSYIVETPVETHRRNSLLLASSQQHVDPGEISPDSEPPTKTEETPGNKLPAEELQQQTAVAPEIKLPSPSPGKVCGMEGDTSRSTEVMLKEVERTDITSTADKAKEHPRSRNLESSKIETNEIRAVIKNLCKKGMSPKKIYENMVDTLREDAPSYSTVKKWVTAFKVGRISTEDEHRPGRPVESVTQENLVVLDRIMTVRHIEKRPWLSDRWVPKLLTPDQKAVRRKLSSDNLALFEANPEDFVNRFVTRDETWAHHFTLESKQQSIQWRHSGSPPPKKAKTVTSARKVMGQTITGNYYANLVKQLREAIKEIIRGKLSRKIVYHQDNAPSHRSLQAMAAIYDSGCEPLPHVPYSPDLAPSDFQLFLHLKKSLSGIQFRSDEEVLEENLIF